VARGGGGLGLQRMQTPSSWVGGGGVATRAEPPKATIRRGSGERRRAASGGRLGAGAGGPV